MMEDISQKRKSQKNLEKDIKNEKEPIGISKPKAAAAGVSELLSVESKLTRDIPVEIYIPKGPSKPIKNSPADQKIPIKSNNSGDSYCSVSDKDNANNLSGSSPQSAAAGAALVSDDISYMPRDNLGIIEKLLELNLSEEEEDQQHSESSSTDGIQEEKENINKN